MASLRRLVPYLRRYRSRYLFGLSAVAVTAALSLFAPWVLQRAIDDLGRGVTGAKLGLYGVCLLALAVAGGATRFLMRRVIIGVSRHVECDIRDDFAGHLSRLPLAFFHQCRTGDLMSRAMNDLEAVRLMIGISVIDACNTVIVFIVAILLMSSIDFRLTLIALTPLPFVSVSVKLFGASIYRRSQRVQVQLAEVTAVTQEALGAARLVRAYGQEETEVERFAAATRLYFARNRSLIRVQSAFYATMTFCLGVGALLVLWIGGGDVVRGRMTLGQFVAFGAYQVMLGIPMIAFGSLTNTVQRGIAAWRRMLEVFEAPVAAGAPARVTDGRYVASTASVPLPERVSVEFRHLTFTYPSESKPVLRDVSFRVEPGQVVAVVGPTGSGKSTLLNLLPRLHEPPPGTVFVNGVDVRELPLDALRAAIGFVPQEPFLFADTLGENIAFAPPAGYERRRWARPGFREEPPQGADLLSGGVDLRGAGTFHVNPGLAEAVRRAASIARLDGDVPGLPQGYDTPLAERGMNLSGGQRQRTALARALMVNPSLLVLDDALSAVDTKTEEEILDGLREEMRRHTSLVVSNRMSTVRAADLILVLDEGRIVERGTRQELLARGGTYAELERRQALQEALADA